MFLQVFRYFMVLFVVGAATVVGKVSNAATGDQEVKFWKIPDAQDVFTSGRDVYLQMGVAGKIRGYLDPVANKIISPEQVSSPLNALHELSNEVDLAKFTVIQNILSVGPRCGLTVGVSYTLTDSFRHSTNLRFVRRLPGNGEHTDYCGTPLVQKYDTPCCLVFASLRDGRTLIVDFASRLAVSFSSLPTVPISIGNEAFLIPGPFLDEQLSYFNQNQARRYGALIHVLQTATRQQATLQTINAE